MAWLRVPWPLPALLAWAAAWLLYAALQRTTVPAVLALLLACALGTAASLLGKTWWRRGLIAAGFPLSLLASGASGIPAWAWLVPLALLLLGLCLPPLFADLQRLRRRKALRIRQGS